MWLTFNVTQRQIFVVGMTYRITMSLGLAFWTTELGKIISVCEIPQSEDTSVDLPFTF